MSGSLSFQAEMRLLLRDRALDAARDITCTETWSAVNMSRIAGDIGVSRPVLYKEFSGKQSLAAALIERETDRFLTGIGECLSNNPDDPVDGLGAAAEFTLRTGAENALIRAVLAGEHGPDAGLLPLLATDPRPVLSRAITAIAAMVHERYPDRPYDDTAVEAAVEALVRLTLSHLMQPLDPVDLATAKIRNVVAGLFSMAAVRS